MIDSTNLDKRLIREIGLYEAGSLRSFLLGFLDGNGDGVLPGGREESKFQRAINYFPE